MHFSDGFEKHIAIRLSVQYTVLALDNQRTADGKPAVRCGCGLETCGAVRLRIENLRCDCGFNPLSTAVFYVNDFPINIAFICMLSDFFTGSKMTHAVLRGLMSFNRVPFVL